MQAGQKFEQAALADGLAQLEALLPGPPAFEINLESMKASDWVCHQCRCCLHFVQLLWRTCCMLHAFPGPTNNL